MMSFKNSIVLTSVFLLNIISLCNLYAQQPTATYSIPFIWADHQNTSRNQFLNLPTAINRQQGFNNFQNNFNQLISQCHKIDCKKYRLPGLPYDCRLIEKICANNLHCDQQTLVSKLAHNETINSMSSYFKFKKHLGHVDENIIIDPQHFKDLPQADKRTSDFLAAAHDAMKKRHNKELETLKSTYNKAKKRLSKNEKTTLKAQYQQD